MSSSLHSAQRDIVLKRHANAAILNQIHHVYRQLSEPSLCRNSAQLCHTAVLHSGNLSPTFSVPAALIFILIWTLNVTGKWCARKETLAILFLEVNGETWSLLPYVWASCPPPNNIIATLLAITVLSCDVRAGHYYFKYSTNQNIRNIIAKHITNISIYINMFNMFRGKCSVNARKSKQRMKLTSVVPVNFSQVPKRAHLLPGTPKDAMIQLRKSMLKIHERSSEHCVLIHQTSSLCGLCGVLFWVRVGGI